MIACANVLAWTKFASKSVLSTYDTPPPEILYTITEDFTLQIRTKLYRDEMFVVRSYDTMHVERIVRAALRAWSVNANTLKFKRIDNASRADIIAVQSGRARVGPRRAAFERVGPPETK